MPRPTSSKPPVSAWLIRERKRVGMKPGEVAARLTAMGLPVQEGTVRTWEAGRSPSPDNIEGLERIFETQAPGSVAPDTNADLAAAIRELVEELRLSRAQQTEDLVAVLPAAVALAVRETLQAAGVVDGHPGK